MSTEEEAPLPADVACLSFMQWVYGLASSELGVTQYSAGSDVSPVTSVSNLWRFARPDGMGFELSLSDDHTQWLVDADEDIDIEAIGTIIARAAENCRTRKYGRDICYVTELLSPAPEINAQFPVQMMRLLGDQRFINMRCRLSEHVILEFSVQQTQQQDYLFVPETRIKVFIFAYGPIAGPLSAKMAQGMLEMARLVCTFALGRPVDAPPAIFPARGEEVNLGWEMRQDATLPTLARNGVSLDVFAEHYATAGPSGTEKIKRSLAAYDAAIRQANPAIALTSFVSGMEALASPGPLWGNDSSARKFVFAAQSLCRDALDAVIDHPSVETAFGVHLRGSRDRRRKRLLYRLYELRSIPAHTGPSSAVSFMETMSDPRSIRVALISELHWRMVLGYLQTPMSFLIGHPAIDSKSTP